MTILVDTNVISDVIHDDPVWRPWSEAQMISAVGRMVINPFIYSELCCRARSTAELDSTLSVLGIGYRELSREALYLASQAFLVYRSRGGKKASPLPDFFVGAHALAESFVLLTRDPSRYETYFAAVRLICP